jgi:uncharacterized membrane protein YfcA
VVVTQLFVPADGVLLAVLAVVMFASAVLQTTTGFGFAVLSAPVLTAMTDGPTAVSTVLITGTVADLLILSIRRSRPSPAWPEVGVLALSSVPGIVLGTMLLVVASKSVLMVVIACAVIVAVALRVWARRRRDEPPPVVGRRWGALAGFLSGTLGAATTLAGPPTVFYLAHRDYTPSKTRDTLVALNLVRLPLSVAALLSAAVFTVLPGIAWLVVAVLAGYATGGRLFGRLDAARFERLTLAGLLLAAGAALVAAFVSR